MDVMMSWNTLQESVGGQLLWQKDLYTVNENHKRKKRENNVAFDYFKVWNFCMPGMNICNIENKTTKWKNEFKIYVPGKHYPMKSPSTFTRERQISRFFTQRNVSDVHTHTNVNVYDCSKFHPEIKMKIK